MRKWIVIAGLVAAGALSFFCSSWFLSENDEKPLGDAVVARGGKVGEKVKGAKVKNGRRERSVSKIGDNAAKKARQKPTFHIDDDDESKLTTEQRKMIEAIRAALEMNDRRKTLKLVQALQASKEWPDGIPKSIKLAAIEALGWFGSSCLPEIVGFLEDLDDEVVQSAIEKFEESLSDFDLTDAERAKIMIQAAKVINDPDAIDSMLMAVSDISNSESVKMFKTLMVEGNDATKKVLPDAVEFFTGEEGMDSPKKLDEWLAQNPDEES